MRAAALARLTALIGCPAARAAALARLTALIVCLAVVSAAHAQDDAARPRIGLVLSGGGARGGAELGVIKALEELRVPIDVVAGTSIGAAIGGLYASGMTVEEIEDFVRGIDWDAAFLNRTPRQLESFRRKREDDLFLLEMRPGIDDEGLALPVGVVQGQVIDTILARVLLPVAHVRDFDELAIPFRAVAGDLETGQALIIGRGNLSRAIRASMAVPAVLTPIEIDGRMLVDGGIALNLPVNVAKAMGADRIIAVDISERPMTRENLRSVVDVTEQLTNLLTSRGVTDQLALLSDEDVLLRPDLPAEYGSTDFGLMAETIDAGYKLTITNRALFTNMQLSPEEYAAWRASLPNPRRTAQPSIDFVRFGDSEPLAPSVIEARIDDVEVGQPLVFEDLERSLNRVYGLGIYQNVRFDLVEEGGQQGLEFDLVERSWGPSYVQLGLRYTSASDEDARFGLAASYLRTGINDLGGEWRATVLFGDEPGFVGDWYQPLGPKALTFINPELAVESTLLNIFENDELVAEARLRQAIFEFGIGRELLDWAEIRGGFRVGAGDTRLHIGDPAAVPFDEFHRGEWFTRFSVDTLDNISFPRAGTFMTAEWRGSNEELLAADVDYDQLLLSLVHARTWSRNTLLTTVRYDTTISGETPAFALFRIGGFRDLSGLNSGEFTGQHVARVGASYYREIGDLALFPAFVGLSAEFGNAWNSRGDISAEDAILGKSIWAGVDTPVGPVFMGYGRAEDDQDAFYLFLGRLF
jgi:NTE family protein